MLSVLRMACGGAGSVWPQDRGLSWFCAIHQGRHSLVSVTLTDGAESLRERLGVIMKYKKKRSKGIRAVMAVCTAAVCACFMAAGAYAAPSAAHEEKESVLQTAAGSDSSNSRYTYAHRGFYMDSYIIEMGWNLTDTMGIIENAGSREIQDRRVFRRYAVWRLHRKCGSVHG